jgi:hypothetical protein
MKEGVHDGLVGLSCFGDRAGKDDAAFVEHDEAALQTGDAQ